MARTRRCATHLLFVASLFCWFAFSSSRANADRYLVTDLGTLGGASSAATAINASGEVTGYAAQTNGETRAFLYDGTMHNLGNFGGQFSYGYAINSSGEVTGTGSTQTDLDRAFLWDSSSPPLHDLFGADGSPSAGTGINDAGQITGYINVGVAVPGGTDFYQQAFMYDGTLHQLGTLGSGHYSGGGGINSAGTIVGGSTYTSDDIGEHTFVYTAAHGMVDVNTMVNPAPGWTLNSGIAINNNGDIIGDGTLGGNTFQEYLFDGTTVHAIGSLGSNTATVAYALNDSDEVVGQSFLPSGTDVHAFLYTEDDGIVDLNTLIDTPGWVLDNAQGINDNGQIVGMGMIGGAYHAYLLTPEPVPEPSGLILAALGGVAVVAGAGFRGRRAGRF